MDLSKFDKHSLTLSGIKEMLKLCKDYALKHKIILMPLKVNLFISHQTQPVCQKTMLKIKSGQVIPYTDTCNYLGNIICSHDDNGIIDNAITYICIGD